MVVSALSSQSILACHVHVFAIYCYVPDVKLSCMSVLKIFINTIVNNVGKKF